MAKFARGPEIRVRIGVSGPCTIPFFGSPSSPVRPGLVLNRSLFFPCDATTEKKRKGSVYHARVSPFFDQLHEGHSCKSATQSLCPRSREDNPSEMTRGGTRRTVRSRSSARVDSDHRVGPSRQDRCKKGKNELRRALTSAQPVWWSPRSTGSKKDIGSAD